MRLPALALVLALEGCAVGRLIHPHEPLVLGTDTLFALAVRSNEYVTLTFCRDADYGSCLTTPQLPRDHPVQLYRVPPGTYCLMDIDVEPNAGGWGVVHLRFSPEDAPCFVTRAGAIAYPGDLEVVAEQSEGIYWTIRPRWSWPTDIDQRVYAQYSDLRGRPIEESRPVRGHP